MTIVTRINLACSLFLLAGAARATVDLPLPLTSALLEFSLHKPYKLAVLKAVSKHDSAEDITVLKSLSIKIDSKETAIPANILSLFEAPRLDTFRLFECPEGMLHRNDLPPKDRIFFAITFRFGARATETESVENCPTAWIAIKNGEIRDIWVIDDIRKSTAPSKEYDPKTLKPAKGRYLRDSQGVRRSRPNKNPPRGG